MRSTRPPGNSWERYGIGTEDGLRSISCGALILAMGWEATARSISCSTRQDQPTTWPASSEQLCPNRAIETSAASVRARPPRPGGLSCSGPIGVGDEAERRHFARAQANPSAPPPASISLATAQSEVRISATLWLASHETYATSPSG